MERVCYYHAGCPDGFGAAWAVWRAWGDEARFVARGHDDPFDAQRHEGDVVVFVDIALDNARLRELAEVADRIILLDHHVSARDHYLGDARTDNLVEAAGHHIHFDLDHSGAVLAWQHFHADARVPELLRYVEDQDLWSWKLPRSEEVNASIGSHPHEFELWDELARRPWEELARDGEPIVRARRIEVQRTMRFAHPLALRGLRVESVNAQHHRSHVGHELAKRAAFGHPIGLVYRVAGTRVDVSLYSIGSVDVSAIARGYGGGGHRNAAGFGVSLDEWLRDFV